MGGSVNIPSGTYRDGQLSNLSFNRWIGDFSAAATWLDPKIGLDVSGSAGIEINGTNDDTDYKSGNAVHVDIAVNQYLSKEFAIGALFSHYQQITGDSGAGGCCASLGTCRPCHRWHRRGLSTPPSTSARRLSRRLQDPSGDRRQRPQGTIALVALAPIGVVPPARLRREPVPGAKVVKN